MAEGWEQVSTRESLSMTIMDLCLAGAFAYSRRCNPLGQVLCGDLEAFLVAKGLGSHVEKLVEVRGGGDGKCCHQIPRTALEHGSFRRFVMVEERSFLIPKSLCTLFGMLKGRFQTHGDTCWWHAALRRSTAR